MRKIGLLSVFVLFSIIYSFCQDTIRIHNSNYTSIFSKSKRYPVYVEWWITKSKVTCKNPIPRKNIFYEDPKLPIYTDLDSSYKRSGFDRGHMSPAADNQCQTKKELTESFYFTNISPQYHSLNAGDWKSLEVYSRELAAKNDSIHVWAGNIGEIKKIGQVSVPSFCWKVVYVKKTNKWSYYIFKNVNEKSKTFQKHEVSKIEFEKVVNFKFNQ